MLCTLSSGYVETQWMSGVDQCYGRMAIYEKFDEKWAHI